MSLERRPKVTVPAFQDMKARGEPIAMVTAYDHPFAELADAAGIDGILVGDTLAAVVQGHATTIPATLDEMVYHTRLVAGARTSALVVGDLPFGSYQVSGDAAVASALRLVKEGGAGAVKLEGGVGMAGRIAAIADAGIAVMGHVGLTPQSVHRMGGYRVQGRRGGYAPGGRARVLGDARAVENAGAFAIVLEGIPRDLGAEITAALAIPTIGVGAGADCDGQILVLHDLLGITPRRPRFARAFVELRHEVLRGLGAYVADTKARRFPTAEEAYGPAGPSEAAPR